jgi:molybdopterin adenylyltransferase
MSPIATRFPPRESPKEYFLMRVAVLTISDSVTKGQREDLSGPAVVAFCRGLGWEITSALHVSDDPANIREQLRAVADSGRVDVLLTTGGTGIGPRDNTPEATQAVADLIVPGLSEEMRRKGLEKTPTAILSRATAAVRTKTLIVNLPGSPKGAVESLEAVAHLLPHAVKVLHGARHD